MVQSLSNLQVHNEILPATARVTYNNQTRVPDLSWILRFNTRYIRASLVYRTIQKGHTPNSKMAAADESLDRIA